jgi:hypothetical protein
MKTSVKKKKKKKAHSGAPIFFFREDLPNSQGNLSGDSLLDTGSSQRGTRNY